MMATNYISQANTFVAIIQPIYFSIYLRILRNKFNKIFDGTLEIVPEIVIIIQT